MKFWGLMVKNPNGNQYLCQSCETIRSQSIRIWVELKLIYSKSTFIKDALSTFKCKKKLRKTMFMMKKLPVIPLRY